MQLTLRDATDRAAAVQRLRRVERHAIDGATAEQMAHGCALLDVIENGNTVGAIAVELQGPRAVVTAAASAGSATWSHLRMLEQLLQRRGLRSVAMFTKRRGLVRRLVEQGYAAVGDGGRWELEKGI